MKRKNFIVGQTLERTEGEGASLCQRIQKGEIVARRTIVQPDGDTRLWGVDVSQSKILCRLKNFGEAHFLAATGKLPGSTVLMVNYIDAQRSPNGSGGGWHRDSTKAQYKAVVYLTDVDREESGAFCYFPNSNGPIFMAISVLYRGFTGGNRYSDRLIELLRKLGAVSEAVLAKAGIPFFVNTSLIHRGLPISEGHRIAAFMYMYERNLPNDFLQILEDGTDR